MANPSRSLLNHCAIFANSLDRSIAFYGEVFGLTVKNRWQEIVLATGGSEQRLTMPGVHLEDSAGHLIEIFENTEATEGRHDERPVNHFAFEVEDVASVYQNALAAGAAPDTPPSMVTAGSLRAEIAFIRGPDGERIELLRAL
jgi:glyoxylase I family protein